MLNTDEKIQLADKLLQLYGDYIEQHADDDLEPREEEYEYAENRFRTVIRDTTRAERKAAIVEKLGLAAENAGLPYIAELIDYLAHATHHMDIYADNTFLPEENPQKRMDAITDNFNAWTKRYI